MDDVEANLKSLADQQSVVQSRLSAAEAELTKKMKQLEQEQLIRTQLDKDVRVAQQNLRTANEVHADLHEDFKKNETIMKDLAMELNNLNRKIHEHSINLSTVKSLQEKYNRMQLERQEDIKAIENNHSDDDDAEYEGIKSQVDVLLEKKTKLDEGDLLTKLILNGQAYDTIAAQKIAAESSINEKRNLVETLSAELTEKQQEIKKIQLSMRIETNQHQARILRMKKELEQQPFIAASKLLQQQQGDDDPFAMDF